MEEEKRYRNKKRKKRRLSPVEHNGHEVDASPEQVSMEDPLETLDTEDLQRVKRYIQVVNDTRDHFIILERGLQHLWLSYKEKYDLPNDFEVDYSNGNIYVKAQEG